MRKALVFKGQCITYTATLMLICATRVAEASAVIDDFVITPINSTTKDLIQVAMQGRWWGGIPECAPANPTVSIDGKDIQIYFTTPSITQDCSTIFIVGIPGTTWADSIPIWKTLGQLQEGTYRLEIGMERNVMVHTSFTVTQEKGLGGINSGLTPRRIHCRNLTTGKKITIKSAVQGWNCEAAGLKVKPGDKIEQRIIGFAKESDP